MYNLISGGFTTRKEANARSSLIPAAWETTTGKLWQRAMVRVITCRYRVPGFQSSLFHNVFLRKVKCLQEHF